MDTPIASTSSSGGTPPIAYVVAVWLGMTREDILAGLASGTIAPPPGAPPGWIPPAGDVAASSAGDSGADAVATRTSGSAGGSHDHGSDTTASRAMVEGWLRAIDPTLAPDRIDTLWQSTGADDASRGAFWRSYLQRALAMPVDKTSETSALDVAIGAAAADPSHRAKIVSLAGLSGADIAALAKNDAGVRYAIDRMDPVALTGNRALVAALDPAGDLDRFDPDSGEQMMSDALIADRSKLVAWKLRRDAGGDLAIGGDARWTFVDRARVGADGKPFTLTLEGAQASASSVAHRVEFGTASADAIAGGAAADRLYGGSGDDFLRGGAGNDRLEGGRGDDTLAAGRGDDALGGGSGNDDVDGGAGDDTLAGDSGDDTLTGGRGDDTLDGGAGEDTYVFDGGDGRDAIVDADGDGRVVLDDVVLSGRAMQRGADGVWRSADGGLEMRYAGTAADPGVLTITRRASSGDAIRIRNWRNGDLGISLGDGSSHALGAADGIADSDASAITDQETDNDPPPVDVPDIGDAPLAGDPAVPDTAGSSDTSQIAAAVTDEPPDITDAAHPLDSLWAMHDRTFRAATGSLVDSAAIASAASAFAMAPPDVPSIATDGHAAAMFDALGGAEIATAAAFAGDDAPATLSLESATATRAPSLAPHDASLAALSAHVLDRLRPRVA
jgi:Ca2+-binding RTX toxin-like protein